MNIEIQKCADSKDIKGLRYIFVDCLDVDPTFDTYKEDFNYCKTIEGFIVEYVELTPFKHNDSDWDEDYWVKLKVDLMKNFSEERFMHMIKVARVVKASKVKRLQAERSNSVIETSKPIVKPNLQFSQNKPIRFDPLVQEQELKEERDALQLENQKWEAEIIRKEHERQERILKLREGGLDETQTKNEISSNTSKKVMGIVAIVVIMLLIIVIVRMSK